MLARISKKQPLSLPEFHQSLREFAARAEPGDTVGDAVGYGGKAWLWVEREGVHFHLNADSTREGVHAYLQVFDAADRNLEWHVIRSQKGHETKVVFGPQKLEIRRFALYRAR